MFDTLQPKYVQQAPAAFANTGRASIVTYEQAVEDFTLEHKPTMGIG